MNNQDAKVLRTETCRAALIIRSCIRILILIPCIIITGIICGCSFCVIPAIGWIIGIIVGFLYISVLTLLCIVTYILVTIAMSKSKATLTEVGIYGNKYMFGTFDVTFDQITEIRCNGVTINIYYLDSTEKKKRIVIYGIENAEKFADDCKFQYRLYQRNMHV